MVRLPRGLVGDVAMGDLVSRPRLLDLFSGAGGASMGYHQAGFDVAGVDIVDQPRYPFEFHRGDALEFVTAHGHEFDAIHASPPCQLFTAYRRKGGGVGDGYLNLIPQTRDLLAATGRPYVIENVEPAAAHLREPLLLCGSMFGLHIRRHRLFETPVFMLTQPCDHSWWRAQFPQATNRTNLRRTIEVGVRRIPLETQRTGMGIDWMSREELSQALPPAYTEFIGGGLLGELGAAA